MFYQGGKIDHLTHVTGPVSKSSADIEYNKSRNSGMDPENFRILNNELLNKDPVVFTEQSPLIILYSKSAIWMANNGNDTKHPIHIPRIIHLVRNGE